MTRRGCKAGLSLTVSNRLLCICEPGPDAPADWTERHVDQGFYWRPGCVCFITLAAGSELGISVKEADVTELSPHAQQAIVVPYEVSPAGLVQIATPVNLALAPVRAGARALIFETGVGRRPTEQTDAGTDALPM